MSADWSFDPRKPLASRTSASQRFSLRAQDVASSLGEVLDEITGEPTAFVLIVCTDRVAQYIGNCERPQGVELLEDLLARWKGKAADIPAHYNPDLKPPQLPASIIGSEAGHPIGLQDAEGSEGMTPTLGLHRFLYRAGTKRPSWWEGDDDGKMAPLADRLELGRYMIDRWQRYHDDIQKQIWAAGRAQPEAP